jgi:hypothetical protein
MQYTQPRISNLEGAPVVYHLVHQSKKYKDLAHESKSDGEQGQAFKSATDE